MMRLTPDELAELRSYREEVHGLLRFWRYIRWGCLVMGVLLIVGGASMLIVAQNLVDLLADINRSVDVGSELFRLPLAMGVRATSAAFMIAIGIYVIGTTAIRWNGSRASRVLAILSGYVDRVVSENVEKR